MNAGKATTRRRPLAQTYSISLFFALFLAFMPLTGQDKVNNPVVEKIATCDSFGFAQTPARPRPVFQGNTLVAGDTFQPLRGVRWALDSYHNGVPVPTIGQLLEIRENGGNAIHVYAEKINFSGENPNSCITPGCKRARLCTLVNRAKEAGLYVIMTIGDGNPPLFKRDAFRQFNLDFWELYAPEFADDTHVVFEIQNEPYFEWGTGVSQPTLDWVIDLNARAYQVIAEHAPETPVLLFTYAFLQDAQGVRTDLQNFETAVEALQPLSLQGEPTTVNWDLVGVAFHGYYYDGDDPRTPINVIEDLLQDGQPIHLVETEGWGLQVQQISFRNVEAYEHYNISWLSFVEPFLAANMDWKFDFRDLLTEPVDNMGGVIWVPESGTWPAVSDPPIGVSVSLELDIRGLIRVNASNRLVANAQNVSNSTKFTVLPGPTGGVILQSRANNNYVRLTSSGGAFCNQNILAATATNPAQAEEFIWMTRDSDGKVALQSKTNNEFVTADINCENNNPIVRANRWRGGGQWSGFDVVLDGNPPAAVPNFVGRINGKNLDGLTIGTSEPLIQFSWGQPQSDVTIDHYQILITESGDDDAVFNETVAFPATTFNLLAEGMQHGKSYDIKIRAWNEDGREGIYSIGGTFSVSLQLTTQTPFLGAPFQVSPAKITVVQAEDFDNGGDTVGYSDTTAGNAGGIYRTNEDVDILLTDHRLHIGVTAPSEWTEYALQVNSNLYDIEVWTASELTGQQFRVEFYDAYDSLRFRSDPLTVPNTGGWGHFQKVILPNIALSADLAGSQYLRLAHLSGNINVDRVEFRRRVVRVTDDAFAGRPAGSVLHGTQTSNGLKTWISHPGAVFAAPGSITNAGTALPYGFVPYTPSEAGGKPITVEADLNIDTGNLNDWASLGFHTNPGSVWGGNGEIWMLVRRDGRYTVFLDGTSTQLASGQLTLTSDEQAAPKRAVLKYYPTGYVAAWVNGVQVLGLTSLNGFTPNINHVGFTAHSASPLNPQQWFVDNFDIVID